MLFMDGPALSSSLSCGIVGLPNVGKSTLFNALTSNQAEASNYPFCTIEPNIGIVNVPDSRLRVLSGISSSRKLVYATMKFVDIAGLVEGASKGEGLGNQFLTNILETDAIVHVVRCFDDENVVHVAGKVDPIRDIQIINLELILSDLNLVEKAVDRVKKQAKANKDVLPTTAALERLLEHLNKELPLRTLELSVEEQELLKVYRFLSSKKVLYVANVAETDLPACENQYVEAVREYATSEGNSVVCICAEFEAQVAQLPEEERTSFLETAGLKEPGLELLITASFEMLGLITYLTTGEIETRAWTIRKGTAAPAAAARIHTDFEKGFIRAEVVSFEDMVTYKGRVGARTAGKASAEGKGYIVRDGDVIDFLVSS